MPRQWCVPRFATFTLHYRHQCTVPDAQTLRTADCAPGIPTGRGTPAADGAPVGRAFAKGHLRPCKRRHITRQKRLPIKALSSVSTWLTTTYRSIIIRMQPACIFPRAMLSALQLSCSCCQVLWHRQPSAAGRLRGGSQCNHAPSRFSIYRHNQLTCLYLSIHQNVFGHGPRPRR